MYSLSMVNLNHHTPHHIYHCVWEINYILQLANKK